MNSTYIIEQLEINKGVFMHLMEANSKTEQLWKPEPNKWCLLEIVCHLLDEEVHDFRTRVKTALSPDSYDFKPIDPEGWVRSKNYMGTDFKEKVEEWKNERTNSISWLKSLTDPDWSSSLTHPDLGEMSARLFLSNWLAHDQLHIRQINGLKRAYLSHVSMEDLSYAGKW